MKAGLWGEELAPGAVAWVVTIVGELAAQSRSLTWDRRNYEEVKLSEGLQSLREPGTEAGSRLRTASSAPPSGTCSSGLSEGTHLGRC